MQSGRKLKKSLRRIHELDTMCDPGQEETYYRVGLSAYEICEPYLSQRCDNLRILDFPSGYGRVTRYFRNFHPKAEIFACELDSRMLDFVTEQFGAIPIQSQDDLVISLPENLDLVFVGSLLTHLSEERWDAFFAMVVPQIKIGGHLIFTTHGRRHLQMAKSGHPIFGSIIDVKKLFAESTSTGFSYAPYDINWPTFGLSLSAPEFVIKKINKWPFLKVKNFSESGWGQDVWILEKIDYSLVEE